MALVCAARYVLRTRITSLPFPASVASLGHLAHPTCAVRLRFPAKSRVQRLGAVKRVCAPNDSQSALKKDRQGKYAPVCLLSDLPPPLLPLPGRPHHSEAPTSDSESSFPTTTAASFPYIGLQRRVVVRLLIRGLQWSRG